MGIFDALFGNPKCPHCGGTLEETGYSTYHPQWRCPACIKRNKAKNDEKQRIESLERRIRQLEGRA